MMHSTRGQPPTRRLWKAVSVALLLTLAASCAVEMGKVYVKDGKEYGTVSGTFRNKWWNYYERGVSYKDGGYFDDAVADFRDAVSQRPEDTRRARTYGLHFTEYYPHRELGIIHFKQGNLEKALEELERSLRHADSAVAKYYLNEVRRAQLKESKADTQPPVLSLENDPGEEKVYTNQPQWTFKGKVVDNTYVDSITVGRERVFFELAQPEVPFEQRITLQPGENRVDLVAADLVGQEQRVARTIVLDQVAPQIIIAQPLEGTVTNRPVIKVEGYASDDSPMAIEIGGTRVKFDRATGAFEQEVALKEGENTLKFSGADKTGNKSEGALVVYYDPAYVPDEKGALYYDPHRSVKTAYAGDPWAVAGLFDRSKQFFNRLTDRDPPELTLKDFIENETVYVEQYYLQGALKDANLLKSAALNGQPLSKRLGTGIIFAQIVDLKEGENLLVLEAEDERGNKMSRTLKVFRKYPKVLDLSMRVTASLLPFNRQGSSQEIGEVAFDNLNTALVEQRRFSLVERDKLDRIIKELEFNQSKLVDPDTQAKLGAIASARMILSGVVTEKPDSMEVYLRLVSVEDAREIIAEADVFGEDKSLSHVNYLMKGLAFKLVRQYPLIEGKVINRTDEGLEISMGRRQGLNPNMEIYIYRDNPNGDANNPIEIGWVPVQGRIETEKTVIARNASDIINFINPGDRIITR